MNESNVERKEIGRRTWKISIIDYDDGTASMERVNDGFDALQLLGISRMLERDILAQIDGLIKPDEIKRTAIVSP